MLTSRREEIIETKYNQIKQLVSKYRKLYEGSPVMLRTIDRDGIILDCNEAYISGLGYSSKYEIVGHSIFDHTPGEAISEKRESFEEWRRTGIVKNKEVWLKKKDGSTFPAMINANNLYDDKGNFIGSNTVITDLSENYKGKNALERSNHEIIKACEMKEEFINIAAHEFRTPIQPLFFAAQFDRSDKVEQEKAWDTVLRQAKRLKQLADDILEVTRIESGHLTYKMQKISVDEIIDEIVDNATLGVQSSHKGGSLAIETKLDNDIELNLDKTRMMQALQNLGSNSIKFTQEGRITIETCSYAYKNLFEIKISDTGTGISQGVLPSLFGKFVTRSSGNNANQQGTGLGLFITKSIIQAHGGDIFGFNNEESRGATFVIRLPIAPRQDIGSSGSGKLAARE